MILIIRIMIAMNNNAAGGVGGGGWLRLLWPWLDIAFIRLKETKASGLAFEVYQLRAVPLQVSELQAHVSELEAWLKEEKHFEQTSRAQRINGRVQEIKPVRPKSNILALEVATAKAEDWVKQHTAVSLSLSLPYRPASNWLGKQHCRRDWTGIINKSRDDCIASCCFLTFIVLTQSHFDFSFSVLFSCNL